MEHNDFLPIDPVEVEICAGYLVITLYDGRRVGLSLEELPWLKNATPDQQSDFELLPQTVYWTSLDDGLDTEELVRSYAQPLPPHLLTAHPKA
jgi:hypothetical protein